MGRGVFDHPAGPAAGARSVRQAWEAIVCGVSLEEYARNHLELREAIKAFGKKDSPDVRTPVLCPPKADQPPANKKDKVEIDMPRPGTPYEWEDL